MFERTIHFKLQQETKGALRYGEELDNGRIASAPNDPGAVIGTLYIRKSALNGGQYPDRLEVRVATTG